MSTDFQCHIIENASVPLIGRVCSIENCNKIIRCKGLSVDHCHKTGVVRKLLCARCNMVLGRINEDINILKNAINYLQEFKNGDS